MVDELMALNRLGGTSPEIRMMYTEIPMAKSHWDLVAASELSEQKPGDWQNRLVIKYFTCRLL